MTTARSSEFAAEECVLDDGPLSGAPAGESIDAQADDRRFRDAVLRGDVAAWNEWYERTFDPLFDFVRWRCGRRRDLVDDIVQDTWLIAVRSLSKFDPNVGSFLGWLRGIAVQTLRSRQRRDSRRLVKLFRWWNDQAGGFGVTESSTGNTEPEEQADIVRALDSLSEQHEAVLRAKYLDQLSVTEIARRWHKSEKGIEALLARARAAFREVYQRMQRDDSHPTSRTRGERP